MGNLTLSGYLAAAISVAFSGTQTLASLANDEWCDLSDAIDNGTNKYALADFELVLGSAAFTGTDSTIALYLVPSVDGTNYGDWTGNVTTAQQQNQPYYVGSFTTSGTTAAQRLTLRDIPLPNGLFKLAVRNLSNVAFAASGNTLKYRPHTVTV